MLTSLSRALHSSLFESCRRYRITKQLAKKGGGGNGGVGESGYAVSTKVIRHIHFLNFVILQLACECGSFTELVAFIVY